MCDDGGGHAEMAGGFVTHSDNSDEVLKRIKEKVMVLVRMICEPDEE